MHVKANERVLQKVRDISPYKNKLKNFNYQSDDKSFENLLKEHLPELNFKVIELNKNKKVLIDFRDKF